MSQHKVILDVHAGDNLEIVLKKLTSRNTLQFAYAPDLLSIKTRKSGKIIANDIPELITNIFGDAILAKPLQSNQILLRQKDHFAHDRSPDEIAISGYIKTKENLPVGDVIVIDLGNGQSTLSDEQGYFELAAQGDSLLFQSIAHHTKVVPIAELDDEIYLEEKPVMLKTIMVHEKIPFMRLDGQNLTLQMPHQSSHMSALYFANQDILKRTQLLPGVRADDDLSAQLSIRGSEGNETLVMMDGIPIYRSEHFYGIFSNINPTYIANSTLYKNGLPSQYGGKTGGMLNLTSHQRNDKPTGTIESNLLYSSVQSLIPLGTAWSLSLAGRKSYLNGSSHQVFDLVDDNTQFYQTVNNNLTRNQLLSSDPSFNFYDVNAKIRFAPADKFSCDLNFFHSMDDFINSYDLSFLSRQQAREVTNTEVFSNNDSWTNTGASFNSSFELGQNWKTHLNLYSTNYRNEGGVESQLVHRVNGQPSLVNFSNSQENSIADHGITVFLSRQKNRQTFKIGTSVQSVHSTFMVNTDERTLLDGRDEGIVSSLFSEYTLGRRNLTWTFGARTSYYSRTEKLYFDPSIRFYFKPVSNLSLKGSMSQQHQFVRSLSYESRLTDVQDYFVLSDGKRYPIGSSFNFMLGSTLYGKRWMVDLEVYRRGLDGVMEYSLVTPGFSNNQEDRSPSKNANYRIFRGTGQVLGADLLLKYEHEKYQTVLSYTLSRSTQKYPAIRRSEPFPAQDDRRHQLQWMHAYKIGLFTVSCTGVYSSGRPYLDLTRIEEVKDRTFFSRNQFLSRLPSYERLDLAIDYTFRIGTNKATLGVSCFNLFNRSNVKYLQYVYAIPTDGPSNANPNTVVGTETGLLNRTFNARVQFEF